MDSAQHFIGIVIFAVVIIIALFVAAQKSEDPRNGRNYILGLAFFLLTIVACYGIIGAFVGFWWCIAWLATWVISGIMWLLEGILYPFSWIIR